MHRQRNIYQSRTLDLLRNCLGDGQDGGCKQRGQTATIWLKALLMPRLAVCSRDLHWHWINWTLLCDTMVSMLRLAWLSIAQHVFQPALTGRLELISRKIVSSEQEQRLSRWADFAKIVSRELNARSYRDFAKNIALLGATSAKLTKSVGKKMGSNMRPGYIQFRDIHDRDISGLHCICCMLSTFHVKQGSRLRRPPMEQDVKVTPLDVKIFDSQVPWDVEIQMSKDALFESRWCRIILTLVLFDTHKKILTFVSYFSNKCADLWVISQHSVLFLCQYSLFHGPNSLRASSTEILLGVIRGECGTVHCANTH